MDSRQRGMLEEMGIRLWPVPHLEDRAGAARERGGSGGSAEPPSRQREAAAGAAPTPAVAARGEASEPTVDATPPSEADAVRPPPAAEPVVVLRQRPSGVESLDWDGLRAAVAACTGCRLCTAGRRQTVFGVGHPGAHWMVVGEAPGEQEDLQGEPFVGRSGQLLDNMLRAIGLARHPVAPPGGGAPVADPARQVYIANTLKCRPPGNRNPQPDELAQCEPFLVRQIALVQPRIILAMGRFAVQSLLRSDEPVGRLRGRVHRYAGVPLVVTYHPAYLLRNPEDKARAWDDLCLAAATAAAPDQA